MLHNKKGFTLIELSIVLCIIASLLMLSIPNLQENMSIIRNHMTTHRIYNDLIYARQQAILKKENITICHLSAAQECDGHWDLGYTIFVASNFTILKQHENNPLHQKLSFPKRKKITFNALGHTFDTGTIHCQDQYHTQTQHIIINRIGIAHYQYTL